MRQEQSWVCPPATEDHVYSGWYDPGYFVFYHLTVGTRMPSEPHPSHPPPRITLSQHPIFRRRSIQGLLPGLSVQCHLTWVETGRESS